MNKTNKKSLSLIRVCEGLQKGIRKNGTPYLVRDDRSRFFYPNEWELFIKSIKPTKRIIFETLIQTGARIEEALNLKPRDFDFDRNNLVLRVTKIKARKGERIGKARIINVSSQYIKNIKAYISKYKIAEDSFIFRKSSQAVYQMMKRNLKKINISDPWNFGLHNIRKTHGNYLKALAIPAEEICLRLGHDFNTYLKHYGSPNIFDRNDKILIIKILGDVYGFK